jgi:hypothetical protein
MAHTHESRWVVFPRRRRDDCAGPLNLTEALAKFVS